MITFEGLGGLGEFDNAGGILQNPHVPPVDLDLPGLFPTPVPLTLGHAITSRRLAVGVSPTREPCQ